VLDSLKPATAHPPSPGSDGLDPSGLAFVPPWVWITVLILVVGLGSWLLFQRRPLPLLH